MGNQTDFGILIAVMIIALTIALVVQFQKSNALHRKSEADKEKADAILRASPEAMLIIDDDGKIVGCNEKAIGLFGYAEPELLGMPVDGLVPARSRAVHAARRAAFITEKNSRMMEGGPTLAAVMKDGTEIDVEISLSHDIIDGRGLTIAVVRDVAEDRQRTRELQEARLEAESASELKSAFLANVSHEVRTPLTGLLAVSQIFKGTGLTEEQSRLVATQETCGKHLKRVLNDILDLSKLDAEKMEIVQEPYDVSEMLEAASDIYRGLAVDKSLAFELLITDGLRDVEVFGDAVRMRQVVLNLVGNAIKFTGTGSVRVSASLRAGEDQTKVLSVSVRDTGSGIAASQMEEVFEPFFQAANGVKEDGQGTGLGLSICRRLVRKMGGEISVASQLGKGSTFTIDVPTQTVRKENTAATPAMPVAPSNVIPFGAEFTAHVLVADDNYLNLKLASDVMETWGVRMDTASNGAEALEKLSSRHYDMALLDVHMPMLSGRAVLEALLEKGPLPCPIYAFTADLMAERVNEYRDKGFSGVVSKPVDWDPKEIFRSHSSIPGDGKHFSLADVNWKII